MNKKIAQVLVGFKNLSESEREKFLEYAKKIQEGYDWEKNSVNESIRSFTLGPKTDACQCCGK